MQKLYLREADAEQGHDLLILLAFEMGTPSSFFKMTQITDPKNNS